MRRWRKLEVTVRYVRTITRSPLCSTASISSARIVLPLGLTETPPALCVEPSCPRTPAGEMGQLVSLFSCSNRLSLYTYLSGSDTNHNVAFLIYLPNFLFDSVPYFDFRLTKVITYQTITIERRQKWRRDKWSSVTRRLWWGRIWSSASGQSGQNRPLLELWRGRFRVIFCLFNI